MNLLEIQNRMLEAVMQPLTDDEEMQPLNREGKSMHEAAAEFIKPNDRLSAFERLEIYNRQYWFRVLSALNEDFPGLRAVVGQPRFEALCKAYLVDCPSESFTMRNLGARLEWWLRSHPEYIQPRAALALDMVRLEWAEIEAFDGAALPVLLPEDSPQSDPDPHFTLQPHLQLLKLHYPVDDLLLAIRKNNSKVAMASNAVSQRRKHDRMRKVARQKTQAICLAVYRLDYSVYFKRLDPEGFAFLTAIRAGGSLSDATMLAFQESEIPANKLLGTVQSWFENWSSLGWFCAPNSADLNSYSSLGKQS